jgi:hypothetical protein
LVIRLPEHNEPGYFINDSMLLFEEEIAQSELISLFEQLARSRSLPVKILVHYEP